MVTLVACGQGVEDVSNAQAKGQEKGPEVQVSVGDVGIDFIEFLSLEDFLKTYESARTGEYNIAFADTWSSTLGDCIEDAIEGVNLTELETLYVPTGIPEGFGIRLITVTDYYVTFRYLPKEVLVQDRDEFWNAATQYPMFEFGFTRGWGATYPMDGILEQHDAFSEDLIDGKHLCVNSNMFTWASGTELLMLYMPHQSDMRGELGGISLDDPHAMISFTETTTLNLQDTRAVEAMIEELEAARR